MAKAKPLVGILMGSTSDWEVMKQAAKMLDEFGVAYDARAMSAHRTPDLVEQFVKAAPGPGPNFAASRRAASGTSRAHPNAAPASAK